MVQPMSSDETREEILGLARSVRQRLEWEAEGGVSALPRGRRGRHLPRRTPEPAIAEPPEATGPALVTAPPSPPRSPAAAALALKVVRDDLGDCRRCKLAPLRRNIVFGVGDPAAPLVFVGEAPGENEDLQGEPFVGKAGELLTRMIVAMGFARGETYICNVIKCRPPGNRNPELDEIAACEPFLISQLGAIAPRVIVTLGKFAAQALLRSDAPISALRGRFQRYQGIALMPTFHPAYLLRNPSAKREVWEDLKQVMRELDRLGVPRAASPGDAVPGA
jgi:uracil-DNA glycosylase family 4